jgi:hypothetical protein
MRDRPRFFVAFLISMLLVGSAFPQSSKVKHAVAPTVTVAATPAGVRFAAHGAVSRMRVEALDV